MNDTINVNFNDEKINEDDIVCCYSGKVGCMCGCQGKYHYSSKNKVEAGYDRGCSVNDKEVSDIAIKRMLVKFRKIGNVEKNIFSKQICYYVENNGRCNVIYVFNKEKI